MKYQLLIQTAGFLLFLLVVSAQHTDNIQIGPDDTEIWLPGSFCPAECTCSLQFSQRFKEKLRTVNCADRNLRSLPEVLPPETQILTLRGNKITNVRRFKLLLPGLLQLDLSNNRLGSGGLQTLLSDAYNLRILDLSQNRLKYVPKNTFEGLRNLQELDLSENRLIAMAHLAFNGLEQLETLRMGGNRLQFLERRWWSPLQNLYTLVLDRNEIPILQASSFAGLGELRTLDLTSNKIYEVDSQAFLGLRQLEFLMLSNNQMAQVPRESFHGLPQLKSLSLSYNPIHSILEDDFNRIPKLRDINLSGMPRLKLVENGAFKDLPELLVLEMHDNAFLEYIDYEAFSQCDSITHLLLHNNNLTVIEEQLVMNLQKLQEISLYGNPLSCDCNARWLKNLYDNKEKASIHLIEASRIVCNQPAPEKFKLMIALPIETFSESCPPRIIQLFKSEYDHAKFGQTIGFDCRAVGIPRPEVHWVVDKAHDGATSEKVTTRNRGKTLNLHHLTPGHSGIYTCVAETEQSSRIAHVSLKVQQFTLDLNLESVEATVATFSWSGKKDEENRIFQIFYRQRDIIKSAGQSHSPLAYHQTDASIATHYGGTITPGMTTFTIRHLLPNSRYEACLSYKDSNGIVVYVSCREFHTQPVISAPAWSGIERTSNVAVGAALGIIVIMLIVIGFAAVGLKRIRSRAYDNLNKLEFVQDTGCSIPSTPVIIPVLPQFDNPTLHGHGMAVSQAAIDELMDKLYEQCPVTATTLPPSALANLRSNTSTSHGRPHSKLVENIYNFDPTGVKDGSRTLWTAYTFVQCNDHRDRIKSTDGLLEE